MAGQVGSVSKLKGAIDKIPLIDHAYSLLKSYEPPPDHPRERLVSLADGDALKDSVYSLAHIRMTRHLSHFFSLPADSSWQAVLEAARARDHTSLCCDLVKAAGIQAMMIDHGLQNNHCHPISWHDQLTPSPNKRIVWIETLFESIVAQSGRTAAFFDFPAAVRKIVSDPDVAGFKSIATYLNGLDLQPLNPEELALKCELAYAEVRDYPPGRFRVQQLDVVVWLVNITCSIISGKDKPLQFHTGIGDSNTNLTKSDPMLLQPLVKAYPKVPFVLLHSEYPYNRQAGYLATVHPNVYLDFGSAISTLSGDGQRCLIRQLLEMCPTNKLLWSSGTIFYPERFYLAALQTREALTEILADYVCRDEIGFDEAIQVAKRMLFENANKLYKLNIDYIELGLQETTGVEEEADERNTRKENTSEDSPDKPIIFKDSSSSVETPVPIESPKPLKPQLLLPEVSESSRVARTSGDTMSRLIASLKSRGIKFVRIAWVNYVNVMQYRVISMEYLVELVGSQLESSSFKYFTESGISVAQDVFRMQIYNKPTPGVSSQGHYCFKPDLSTMWTPPFPKGYAHMLGQFFHQVNAGGKELETCPRTILHRLIQQAEQEMGVKFTVNFETGFILREGTYQNPVYAGASTSNLQQGSVTDCMYEIVQNIVDAGVKLNTYNAQSLNGNSLLFEIVTGSLRPMQAADALVATREIIYYTAQKHSFQATLVPRLYTSQVSTHSQVHISVQSPSSDIPSNHPDIPSLPKDLASFMAGLIARLDSVCAFTLPLDACYPRVTDNPWNASVWSCWSTENMDAPIRLCGSEQEAFNVEVRTFDGTANPFLGLAAILGAGLIGLRGQDELEMRDYRNVVPQSKYTPAEDSMRRLGITTKMPASNKVFETGPDEMTEFVKTWLPEEAWKLYKDIRNHEKNSVYSTYGPNTYCKQHY